MPTAHKTLAAINDALISDQGAKFRGLLRHTMPMADDAYSEKESDFRAHLGASVIGRKCPREVWYSFRWTTAKKFDGRMLRLFNRGHLEEPRMVALLQMIGCTVYQYDDNGKQFRILGHKGHYGGSLDAVIVGCPDIPDQPLLGEFKTHNDKSFAKLISDGLLAAKWEHYIQMQQYMGKNNLKFGLYMATNKNTDEIHGELIAFDAGQYERYRERSVMVIDAATPPPKINNSPAWFECKFCDHAPVCHGKAAPVRTCRSCVHSLPIENGEWVCTQETRNQAFGDVIPLGEASQLKACEHYTMIPEMKQK